jgi:hypothetical protein
LKACVGHVSWKACGGNVSLMVVGLFTWCLMDRDELGGLFGDFNFVSSSRGGSVALCLFQSFFCARVQYWLLRTTRWPSLARLSEVWTHLMSAQERPHPRPSLEHPDSVLVQVYHGCVDCCGMGVRTTPVIDVCRWLGRRGMVVTRLVWIF